MLSRQLLSYSDIDAAPGNRFGLQIQIPTPTLHMQEEREAAVAVVEHMIRDYRVLFSQRKRGRPLFAPADEADGAVLAAERAERMPSAPAQPRHPLPLTNVRAPLRLAYGNLMTTLAMLQIRAEGGRLPG